MPGREPEVVYGVFRDAISSVVSQAKLTLTDISSVGVCSPGQADLVNGIIVEASNFPTWRNVPLCQPISAFVGAPCVLENDARGAAAGEWWAVSRLKNQDIQHMILMTLGTGVGGGVIVNGQLVVGMGMAGEIGHTIVSTDDDAPLCGCGQKGCLEKYVSSPGIINYALDCIKEKRPVDTKGMNVYERFIGLECVDVDTDNKTDEINSSSSSSSASSPSSFADSPLLSVPTSTITANTIFDLLPKKDPLAVHIYWRTAYYIATTLLNATRVLDCEAVVLGGGVAEACPTLPYGIRRIMTALSWRFKRHTLHVVKATLGNDAGFVGAAKIAKDRFTRK